MYKPAGHNSLSPYLIVEDAQQTLDFIAAVFSAHVHVYVPDVDASFEKAKQAGGKVVQEPVQKDDPDKRGGITDPSGITWWLATTQGFNNA